MTRIRPGTVRDDFAPIVRTLRATGWPERIDRYLATRSGPNTPLPAIGLFTAIAYLGHTGAAYQHERILRTLQQMPARWQDELPLPMRAATRSERRATGRTRVVDLTVDQIARKFHRCHQAIAELDGGLDAFTSDVLWAAIPDNARHLRHLGVDGTPMKLWVAQRTTKDVEADPDASWTWFTRGKKGDPDDKRILGYLNMVAMLYDPTDEITTPYIAGLRIATGAAPEGKVAARVLRQTERHMPVLDLVVADGAIANTIEMHDTTRERGGDLVMRPSEHQQQAIAEIGDTGYSSWLGRVISPSANLAALSVDADGVQLFPTVPPRSKDAADNAEWLQNLDDWFERFNRIDVFTARNITLPDLQGTVRVASPGKSPGRKINCCATCGPHRNDLPTAPTPPDTPPPACTCASTTIRRDDHPMRTWQPFPYGTPAWAHLYFGGRDRIEGVVADVRETMHLKGGRNECRIRGIDPISMLAAVLGMTRNLQLAQRLRPPSGRIHRRTSRRIFCLDTEHRTAMPRTLARRAADRDDLPAPTRPTLQPLPNGPPRLP